MNISENKKKPSASEDLTVVLIRGNGSPRSFRVSLPALHRSLTALGFLFALAILASVVLIGFSLIRTQPVAPAPVVVAETPPPEENIPSNYVEARPEVAVDQKSGIWGKLTGTKTSQPSDSEALKEVAGLREDVARLNSQLDGRKELPENASSPLLLMTSPRSALIPESESSIRIRNAGATRDPATKQILLDFELHNVDPRQRQERGYIVAIAKSQDVIVSYPGGIFAPSQNILINFTKGETFAISRFRQARATFPLGPLDNRKVNYQILLFGTDGRVIANQHVEETR